MKFTGYIIWFFLMLLFVNNSACNATETGFQAYYRNTVLLNGEWRIIVDAYENGFYNYRWEPFDEMVNSASGGYFYDEKPSLS